MLTKSFIAGCISATASAISLSQPTNEIINLNSQNTGGIVEDFPPPGMIRNVKSQISASLEESPILAQTDAEQLVAHDCKYDQDLHKLAVDDFYTLYSAASTTKYEDKKFMPN